jgi:hypothetical protein
VRQDRQDAQLFQLCIKFVISKCLYHLLVLHSHQLQANDFDLSNEEQGYLFDV